MTAILFAIAVLLRFTVTDVGQGSYLMWFSAGMLLVSLVELLTHDKKESYSAYLDRVAANPYASLIKTADLLHNCNMNRLSIVSDNDLQRREKYLASLRRLWPVVQNSDLEYRIHIPSGLSDLLFACS